ncbi:hypothetical protein WJX74_001039 [Apatococcus lobatus]|uniref:DUF1995 domain-containing protein n=1 Tax=Apatococcus lobatus TaxID=904363 RepID=A0AAW1SDK5_9CHLO
MSSHLRCAQSPSPLLRAGDGEATLYRKLTRPPRVSKHVQRLRPSKATAEQAFPRSYPEAIRQAQQAVQSALRDGAKLLEVEFPPASLEAVSGDAEGANEMSYSMGFLRQFCRIFQDQAGSTRIFFPDDKELQLARQGSSRQHAGSEDDDGPVFGSTKFQLDFLTRPSILGDIGLDFGKVKFPERVKPTDELFICAYPHFNVQEFLEIQELHRTVASQQGQPIIVFNGELDRMRGGYYPALFYPKVAQASREFLPLFERAFYIHNFKGSNPGALFRAYPGPWQVLRRGGRGSDDMQVVHTQADAPSLREVSLDILSST